MGRWPSVAVVCLCMARLACADSTDDAVRAITAALRARHFQEALEQARVAQKAAPKEVRILVLEGMALTGLHKDGEALTVLKSAIAIAPDYVPALESAVEIEYRTGDADAAAHLNRLLTLRPGDPTVHAMLGALAWKRSDCATVVEHYPAGGNDDRFATRCAAGVRCVSESDETAGGCGRSIPSIGNAAGG